MPKIVTEDCRRYAAPLHPLEGRNTQIFVKKDPSPETKIISNISDTYRANIIKSKIFDASPIN